MQDDHGNKCVGFSATTPSGQPEVPTIDRPDPDGHQKMNEHMLRGIAYREKGEYVKSIDEFLGACQLASNLDLDWGECNDNLERMLFVLHYYFNSDVDPDSFRFWEGEPLAEATLRELAAKTTSRPVTSWSAGTTCSHATRSPKRDGWPPSSMPDVWPTKAGQTATTTQARSWAMFRIST